MLHCGELFVKTKIVQISHPSICLLPKSVGRSNICQSRLFALGAKAAALTNPLGKMGSHRMFKTTLECKSGPK